MAVSDDHFDKWSIVFILTDQMYTTRKYQDRFVSKSLSPRPNCINLVLNWTSYDSCSALMSSIKPKYPLINENYRNQIVQSRALEYMMNPIIKCGKCSNWSNYWCKSPISKCYHIETLANTGNILTGT